MKPADQRKALGNRGEDMAAAYLSRRGLEIVTRNWRPSGPDARELRGELDIIARDGSTLVFVEVRTRRGDPGLAEESVTPAKAEQVTQLARAYLQAQSLDENEIDWRIDVIAISLTSSGPKLNWLQNALA